MRRLLLYITAILLLSTTLTSFGWYLACNKPCDPEIITLKGDTVFLTPAPVNTISLKDAPEIKQKRTFLQSSQKANFHKVQKGETIYGIATRIYGIPALSLMALNGLTTPDIEAGQKLYIGTPEQRDSIRTALNADSLYTYEKTFEDKSVKGKVITQSTGPVLSQHIFWENLAVKPRNRFYMGGSLDRDRTLSGMAALELKSGWMFTGQVGVIGTENIQIGVMKRFK